jgi:hypothetical protein
MDQHERPQDARDRVRLVTYLLRQGLYQPSNEAEAALHRAMENFLALGHSREAVVSFYLGKTDQLPDPPAPRARGDHADADLAMWFAQQEAVKHGMFWHVDELRDMRRRVEASTGRDAMAAQAHADEEEWRYMALAEFQRTKRLVCALMVVAVVLAVWGS